MPPVKSVLSKTSKGELDRIIDWMCGRSFQYDSILFLGVVTNTITEWVNTNKAA